MNADELLMTLPLLYQIKLQIKYILMTFPSGPKNQHLTAHLCKEHCKTQKILQCLHFSIRGRLTEE